MLRRLGSVLRTGRLSRFEHPEVHRQEQQDGDKVDHKGAVPAQGGQIAGAGQHQHRQRRANYPLHRQPEAALFVVKVIDQHGVSDGQHYRLRQSDAEAAAKDAGQGGDVERHCAADAIQQRGAEQQFTAAKFIRQPAGAGPGDGDHQTGRGEHQRYQGFDTQGTPAKCWISVGTAGARETIARMGRKAVRAMMMPWIAPACGAWGGFRLWLTTFSFIARVACRRRWRGFLVCRSGIQVAAGIAADLRVGAGTARGKIVITYVIHHKQKIPLSCCGFAAIKKATDVAFRGGTRAAFTPVSQRRYSSRATISSAARIARATLVSVGLQAVEVGITPLPPTYRL